MVEHFLLLKANWLFPFVCRHLSSSVKHCERLRSNAVPLRSRKSPKQWNATMGNTNRHKNHFVDYKRVRVIAGDGGDGGVKMASIFGEEFAGPDGGNGGNGAHVLFQASSNASGLERIPSVINGECGVAGNWRNQDGKNAPHKIIEVPPGTIFRNLERQVVAEVLEVGDIFLAAKGGAGGRGNASFKTSILQAPKLAEYGGKGESFTFDIELRSIAHVGLIGFPNAGKSTLLRNISRARPKVAAYPFTTLKPSIGMVQFDDYFQLAVADLPGIIEDAHRNRGLGIEFLRHIERCLCLLYVIDLSCSDPIGQYETLKYELEQYQSGLSRRPHGILANKIDSEISQSNLSSFAEYVKSNNERVFFVSGKMGLNLKSVLHFMRELCEVDQKNGNNPSISDPTSNAI